MFITLNRIFNLGFVGLVGATVYYQPFLFSLHPLAATIAWTFLCEGRMSFRKERKIPRGSQIDGHSFLMFFFTLFTVITTGIIYQVKEANNKPHFTSVHGNVAGIATIASIVLVIGGNLFRSFRVSKSVWVLHKVTGVSTILAVSAALYLHSLHADGWLANRIATQTISDFAGYAFAGSFATLMGHVIVNHE